MMNHILRTLCSITLVLGVNTSSWSQISEGGLPPSFQKQFSAVFSNQTLPVKRTAALDMNQVKKEDAALDGTVRFAAPLPLSIHPQQEGQWLVLPNGDRVWRLHLQVPEALGIFVVYQHFQLPEGARLFMYSPDQQQMKGAYTIKNNKPHQKFMTGMIEGNAAILEYWETAQNPSRDLPFEIERLFVAYNTDHIQAPDTPFKTYDGFGDAMSCNVNINCPSGNNWQEHKRGIVRMLRIFDEGVGWCTGSLINNTNQDGTPYILSAFHCIAGFTPQLELWRFDFNYESADCSNPVDEPDFQSLLGCTYRSGREQTDFLLLELEDAIPHQYDVYYNGWNRESTFVPSMGTGIHHARGDIKKISLDNDPAVIFGSSILWSNGVTTPPNHHFRFELDEGTIEDGSSGSPIFDQNGWIVGQLHGGNASCATNTFTTYYGRFSLSWDTGTTVDTRLMEWLDPAGTEQLILGAYEPPSASISGNIQTSTNQDIAGVTVLLSGAVIDSVVTDLSGDFQFSDLPISQDYTLSFSKTNNSKNGVNIFDLILISDHILGINQFSDMNLLLAADANSSGTITGFDLVEIRKVILNITNTFPLAPSWIFDNNPILIQDLQTDLIFDVTGIKIGDVNYSADPGN